jgi:type VI secretion system protein ImpE
VTTDLTLHGRTLAEALTDLQQRVRSEPSSSKQRVFLFQLLSVLGQWERALSQLEVAGELDTGALAMVQTYRTALRCEALRAAVFAGERSPLVLGEPEEWLALLMEALKRGAAGQFDRARELRDRAFEQAPTTAGRLQLESSGQPPTDTPFEWIADADPRLGPVLEAVVNGRYYWIPFHRIRLLLIEKPSDLRDLVWAPAQFQWTNGGEAVGLVPTRYPGSESSEDDGIRMARKTEWSEPAAEVYFGLGQRMLATDVGEIPLLELRRVELDSPAESGGGEDRGG